MVTTDDSAERASRDCVSIAEQLTEGRSAKTKLTERSIVNCRDGWHFLRGRASRLRGSNVYDQSFPATPGHSVPFFNEGTEVMQNDSCRLHRTGAKLKTVRQANS